MKKSNFAKISNIIILSGFSIILISNIVLAIIIDSNESKSEIYQSIAVSTLFLITYILSKQIYKNRFSIIPETYYYITMLFGFLSVYLGSYLNFYEAIFWWDTMLHFSSGILLGLLSIIIVSFVISNNFGEYKNKRDIITLVVIGVLLSMSLAIFWEFYEFTYDYILDGNMQRGIIIENAENFDPTPYMRASGRFVDPGLTDTMKDMFLATTGAFIAGIYSFIHFNQIQLKLNKKNSSN